MIDVARYLDRIEVDPQTGPPGEALLAHLQAAHLMTVPFENLDVVHRRGVRTDLEWSYAKIVERRRGGWCFEQNGCFGSLIRALGFDVDFVSCRVFDADSGEWGPDLDHLALVVRVDGDRFLVDVGFGDNCVHPVPLEAGERPGVPRPTRIELTDDGFVLSERMPGGDGPGRWEPQLHGSFAPRVLADFSPRSEQLQHDPASAFWQKPFATRALDATGSRLTLRSGVLRSRAGTGDYIDTPVEDPAEWSALLQQHFGLTDTRDP